MSKPIRGLLATMLLLGALLQIFVSIPVVGAADFCNDTIVDQATYLNNGKKTNMFASNPTLVQNAANAVVNSGATLRIRTVNGLPNGYSDLDHAVPALAAQCQSWQSGGSTNWKANLLVIFVWVKTDANGRVTGGDTYINQGSMYDNALNPVKQDIKTNTMNKKFQAGDYVGGMVDGLNRIAPLIKPAAVSQPVNNPPAAAATAVPPTANQPVTTTQSKSSSNAGKIFLIIFLIIVAIAVLFFVFGVLLPSRRNDNQEKRDAQRGAKNAKNQATDHVRSLQDTNVPSGIAARIADLVVRIDLLRGKAADAALNALQADLDRAKALGTEGARGYNSLVGDSKNDPDRDNLSARDYRSIESLFQANVLDKFNKAHQLIDGVDGKLTRLENDPSGSSSSPAPVAQAPEPIRVTPDPTPIRPVVSSEPEVREVPQPPRVVEYRPLSDSGHDHRVANQEMRDADTELARAEGYITRNWYYVDFSTKDVLSQAYNEMAEARSRNSARSRIDHARRARNLAQRAYNDARLDVMRGTDYRDYPGYYPYWGYNWYGSPVIFVDHPDYGYAPPQYVPTYGGGRANQEASTGWVAQPDPITDGRSWGGSSRGDDSPSTRANQEASTGWTSAPAESARQDNSWFSSNDSPPARAEQEVSTPWTSSPDPSPSPSSDWGSSGSSFNDSSSSSSITDSGSWGGSDSGGSTPSDSGGSWG